MATDNEKLGQAIDRLENLSYSITLNLPDKVHVEQMQKLIPEIVQELKDGFIETTGQNPWE